ncbi:hypothetical protein AcV5_001723 [Taiwanofungus camphoratus]|nr:hypothetical protein AcV5_001723 [Antrodia cinnamomea]
MLFSAFLSLVLLPAFPPLAAQNASSYGPCSGLGLGEGAFDSSPYNITLTAVNLTLPNDNSTGAPLVLGHEARTSPAAGIATLATYLSVQSNYWPSLTLLNGTLVGNPSGAEYNTSATDFAISPGEEVSFVVATSGVTAFPAPIYCAIVHSPDDQVLAINGDPGNFSLCTSGSGSQAQNNLVWQPTSNQSTYYYDSCYPVRVQLNPY